MNKNLFMVLFSSVVLLNFVNVYSDSKQWISVSDFQKGACNDVDITNDGLKIYDYSLHSLTKHISIANDFGSSNNPEGGSTTGSIDNIVDNNENTYYEINGSRNDSSWSTASLDVKGYATVTFDQQTILTKIKVKFNIQVSADNENKGWYKTQTYQGTAQIHDTGWIYIGTNEIKNVEFDLSYGIDKVVFSLWGYGSEGPKSDPAGVDVKLDFYEIIPVVAQSYKLSGDFTSDIVQATNINSWGKFSVAETMDNQSVTYLTKTGPNPDGVTDWSNWAPVTNPQTITGGRQFDITSPVYTSQTTYVQWKAVLNSAHILKTPAIHSLSINYTPDTFPPIINIVPIPNPVTTQNFTISGTANDTTSVIKSIDYSFDNIHWTSLTPTDGTFDELSENFSFVTPIFPSGSYNVYIRAIDVLNNGITHTYPFVVNRVPPTVLVKLPTGGERINTSQKLNVAWYANDAMNLAQNPISIDYSVNGGNTWTQIATNLSNSGKYEIQFPDNIDSTLCKIRVRCKAINGTEGSGVSGGYFTVSPSAQSSYQKVSGWVTKTIDSGGVGEYCSISVVSPNVYISYFDRANGALKYANYNGSNWTTQSLGIVGSETRTSIKNGPNIAYFDVNNKKLKYAWLSSDNEWRFENPWTFLSIDPDKLKQMSLDIDHGQPAISYYEAHIFQEMLDYRTDNGTWLPTEVVPIFNGGGDSSLVFFDPVDFRACFIDGNDLRLVINNGNNQTDRLIDYNCYQFTANPSLKYDHYFNHISYSSNDGTVKYARWDGVNLIKQTIGTGRMSSLVVCRAIPDIAYYNHVRGVLQYATQLEENSGWAIQDVDTVGNVGSWLSLDIDYSGLTPIPHIAYYDATNASLKYATPGYRTITQTANSLGTLDYNSATLNGQSQAASIVVANTSQAELALNTVPSGTNAVGSLFDITPNNTVFDNAVLTIKYTDNDLTYSGNTLKEKELNVYTFNEQTSQWNEIPLTIVERNQDENWIKVKLEHASLYGLFGRLPVKEFVCTIKETGGDYNSLSSWQSAVHCDLTSSIVFDHSGLTGSIPDSATVTGETSGATGTAVHVTSSQILIKNITSRFINNEKIYYQNSGTNYITTTAEPYTGSAVAKIDGLWTSPETSNINIDGWVTSPENYIKIYTTPEAKHTGRWFNSAYRLTPSTELTSAIKVNADYVRIEGLQIANQNTQNADGIEYNGAGELQCKSNIIHSARRGIAIANNSDAIVKIWNNMIYDFSDAGIRSYNETDKGTSIIYNNTLQTGYQNVPAGIYLEKNNAVYLKNNLIQNSSTHPMQQNYKLVNNVAQVASNNISEDATSPDTAYRYKNVSFKQEILNNFLLSKTDNVARNHGIDLSNDPYLVFSDDINGDSRSYDVTWDIGADEKMTIPPSAVNDLVVTTGEKSGQAVLTWSAPNSNIPKEIYDGKFMIQYDMVTPVISGLRWTVFITTEDIVPGQKQTVVLSKLARGVTFYFFVKTQDEDEIYSLRSNEAGAPTQNLNEPYFYWDMQSIGDTAPNAGPGFINYTNPDEGPITNSYAKTGNGISIPSTWNTNLAYFDIDPANINPDKRAIEFWYKPDFSGSPGSWCYLFFGSCTTNTSEYSSFYGYISGNPSYPMGFMADSANNVYTVTSDWQAEEGKWYHLKFLWDRLNQKVEIWIDGEKKSGTVHNSANWQPLTFYNFTIGNKYPGSSYGTIKGTMDELYIYDIAAPAAITDLYAETGTNSGQADLTWTSPGESGNTGTLTGKYYIQYSTWNSNPADTNYWQTTKAQIIISTADANPSETQRITVSKLMREVTYYFCVWSQNIETNISGISNQTETQTQNLNEPYFYWDMENLTDLAPNIGKGGLIKNDSNNMLVSTTVAHVGKAINFPTHWTIGRMGYDIDPTNLNTDAGEIEFWYKPNSTGPANGQWFFAASTSGISGTSNCFDGYIEYNTPWNVYFYTDKINNVYTRTTYTGSIWDNNTWYHIKFAWDRSIPQAEIWVNGEKKSQTLYNAENWQALAQQEKFLIGSKGNSGYRNCLGTLDEFYIYPGTDSTRGIMNVRKRNTADPTFKLGDVYAYPNPAKGRYKPTIHVEVGIADSVEIKIYNIAAELVKSEMLEGTDHQTKDGKYCYEYQWNTQNVASGVYIYSIKAEKLGESPIRIIKKLAVIK